MRFRTAVTAPTVLLLLSQVGAACSSKPAIESVDETENAVDSPLNVTTHHNDNQRTGSYTAETTLTPANVRPGSFGRLTTHYVDGMIFAQPLYVHGVNVGGTPRNLVFVATRNNKVYAFDAKDSSDPTRGSGDWVWLKDFLQTPNATLGHCEGAYDPSLKRCVAAGFIQDQLPTRKPTKLVSEQAGCGEQRGPVGITSTPVIDAAAGVMYVVVRASDFMGNGWPDDPVYFLHALDIATGDDMPNSPVEIGRDVPAFSPKTAQNRPALLLSNGTVYVAFGSLACDHNTYHGFVFSFDARTLESGAVLNTTPDRDGAPHNGGGIWQSGNGPAADQQGNLYFLTGNSSARPVCGSRGYLPDDLGNGVVKVDPKLASPQALYPASCDEYNALQNGDVDIGSGGPLLLPGGRFVGGGKEGKLYVVDTQSWAGGLPEVQAFLNTLHPEIPPQNYQNKEKCGPNLHAGLVFLQDPSKTSGRVYGMPEKERLEAFRYDGRTLSKGPIAHGDLPVPDGMPGAALSLSSNGGANAIVWASMPQTNGQWSVVNGRLVAFDAMTMKEIWRDDDDVAYAKFVPPTIAEGRVFRATGGNELIVYGPTTAPQTPPCYTIQEKFTTAGGVWAFGKPDLNSQIPTPPSPTCNAAGDACWIDFNGDLDAPLGDVRPSLGDIGASRIYWTRAACAHSVVGSIHDLWMQPGPGAALGFPVSDEQDGFDARTTFHIRTQKFQNGAAHFYWRFKNDLDACVKDVPPASNCGPRGEPPPGQYCKLHPRIPIAEDATLTVETHGRIYNKWLSEGGGPGNLGYPITNESVSTLDGNYRVTTFEFGRIYWHAAQAPHDTLEVHGGIYDKYLTVEKTLGLPVSDEEPITAFDQESAQMSTFQGGVIVWRPSAGAAFEVHGAIYNAWIANGKAGGDYGLPISDEVALPSGAVNRFHYADIAWNASNGSIKITRHAFE